MQNYCFSLSNMQICDVFRRGCVSSLVAKEYAKIMHVRGVQKAWFLSLHMQICFRFFFRCCRCNHCVSSKLKFSTRKCLFCFSLSLSQSIHYVMNRLRPVNFSKNYAFSLAQNMPILASSGTFWSKNVRPVCLNIFNDFYSKNCLMHTCK